jgi:hypothetical protein
MEGLLIVQQSTTLSQSGGIGRRAGFKIQCPYGRVGSSPTSGTKEIETTYDDWL